MPPRRKDATQPRTINSTSTSTRLQEIKKRKFSPLRFLILLVRIGICIFALRVLWLRFNPKPTIVDKIKDTQRITYEEIQLDEQKRDAVLEAFKWSYKAYERDAFGSDDFHPISHHGTNMSPSGPIGYFLIDSLDSLWIAGMEEEYQKARDWVEGLSFDLDDRFHTFEITIRVLGGLLSAFHLTGETDQMLLSKAIDLADRLLPAFETPSGLPMSFVNLAKRKGIPDPDNHGLTSVAEAGTLQLEFKYLSELTQNPIYWKTVEKAMNVIAKAPSKDGLVPIFMRPDTGHFIPSDIRLGSRGDSYYEYLLKQYLQTNRTEPKYREMHDEAMGGIKKWLVKKSLEGKLVYTSELQPRKSRSGELEFVEIPKQDHLVCFLSAALLLGASTDPISSTTTTTPASFLSLPVKEEELTERQTDDWYVGKELLKTCVDTYVKSKTGLAPEIVNFYTTYGPKRPNSEQHREWYINSRKLAAPNPPIDARNILRPETVESLFVAYRMTGDPIYREWGWTIFQAFEKHCRLPGGGYASVLDVDQVPVKYEDRMETFWISETLKYLLLLFSGPDLIPLDRYVFNTEAHPLPIFTPTVV